MNDKLRCCKEVRGLGTYGWLHPAHTHEEVLALLDNAAEALDNESHS